MTAIPFVTLDDPRYGEAVAVAPLVRRVVARNPSKFTYHGTGTYLVGTSDEVAVIDPGPRDDAHLEALLRAVDGARVVAVLVTHCHADHSPLAPRFAAAMSAPTVGFGPHPRPDPAEVDDDPLDELAAPDPAGEADGEADGSPAAGGAEPVRIEESTDHDFQPDVRVAHGEVAAAGSGWTLRAVHTPGHTSNHLCFALEEARGLFTGDHIMGWSTSVIGPPDGDMRAYLHSLQLVRERGDEVFWPTHGAPVTETRPFLDAFVAHRLEREAQVLAAVRAGHDTIVGMVPVLYAGVRPQLHRAAARSVLAHLVKLVDDGLVAVDGGGPARLRSVYRSV